MLQHLIILLDDTSVPFCHASYTPSESKLIPYELLKRAIVFGMKQNLMLNVVYPQYTIPSEYEELIESIDHVKIGKDVDVVCAQDIIKDSGTTVLRISIADFCSQAPAIASSLSSENRINVAFIDVDAFNDEMISRYSAALHIIAQRLLALMREGYRPQFNLLTDILYNNKMLNCDAGVVSITLAPNGNFYICPAFYYDEYNHIDNQLHYDRVSYDHSVGNIINGLNIPNKSLLDIRHAPLCRNCDAYHCHRCVWLNSHLTGDINTPSHQQCVMSHIERNVSREIALSLSQLGITITNIPAEIDYLDPFEFKITNL